MIVTPGSTALYVQPTSAPQPEPAPEVTAAVAPEPEPEPGPEPAAKGSTRGLALLSGETAAVLIAQQTEAPATPSALDLSERDLRTENLFRGAT